MKTFFIAGLPRSRTTWLANLFNTDFTICRHDDFDVLSHGMPNSEKTYSGLACSWPLDFKADKRVFICRDPNIAYYSYCRSAAPGGIVERILKNSDGLTAFKNAFNWLVPDDSTAIVAFEDLSDPWVVAAIWRHCCPSIPPDMERINILQDFMVTTSNEKIEDQLRGLGALGGQCDSTGD